MNAGTIEVAWVVLWLITLLCFLPMERWAKQTAQDQEDSAREQERAGILAPEEPSVKARRLARNRVMTSLAGWFLLTFRLLALTACLMVVIGIPGLFLPNSRPAPDAALTEWQQTLRSVSGWVTIFGLFGACGALLTIAVMSLRIWAGLQARAAEPEPAVVPGGEGDPDDGG